MLKKKILGNLAIKKAMLFPGVASAMAAGTSVVAFAAEGSAELTLPKINITTQMLQPLVEGIVAKKRILVPVMVVSSGTFSGLRRLLRMVSIMTGVS